MELKIFLLLFILGSILNYFFAPKGHLFCGLWGFCGSSAPDPQKLSLLALYNVKRGEHATGYYADNVIFKDTKPANTFLAENYTLIQELANIKSFVVIGHDRAASVGTRDNKDQAHPHGVLDGEKYKIVLAHNGTLSNFHPMADHYKVEHITNTNSDSQTLTKIMAGVEETKIVEVLQQYDGTASLLFTLPRHKHTLLVHRDPQRELFYFQEAPDRLYVSSIKESLLAIGGTEETVGEFKGYELVKIVKGKMVKTWSTSERTPITYKRSTVKYPNHTQAPLNFHGRNSANSFYHNNDVNNLINNNKIKNGFVFKDMLYYNNGHKFTGKMYINPLTNEWCREQFDGFHVCWFICGVMMKDENSYNILYEKCSMNNVFQSQKFECLKKVDICEYTKYPPLGNPQIAQGTVYWIGKEHRKLFGNDKDKNLTFIPLLSNVTYKVSKVGTLLKAEELTEQTCEPKERKILKDKSDDLETALRTCLSDARHTDFINLTSAVRYALKKSDDIHFNESVKIAFLDLCEQENVVTEDYLADLRKETGSIQKSVYQNLNVLLQMYYSNNEPKNHGGIKEQIERLQNQNGFFQQQLFIEAIDNVEYEDLDAILITYAETDEEENTKPLLMAVALELARLGIIDDSTVIHYNTMSAVNLQNALTRDYEKYIGCVVTPECCSTDPTSMLANYFFKARNLKSLDPTKTTDKEESELVALTVQIQSMIDEGKINDIELKKKYDLTLTQIKAIL